MGRCRQAVVWSVLCARLRAPHPGPHEAALCDHKAQWAGAPLSQCQGGKSFIFTTTHWKLSIQTRAGGYNAFEKDFAIINIFFGDATAMGKEFMLIWSVINHFPKILEYERSKRMTPIDFVSSLGGLFGLFLGFSLLSFVEILYWFIVVLGRRTFWG